MQTRLLACAAGGLIGVALNVHHQWKLGPRANHRIVRMLTHGNRGRVFCQHLVRRIHRDLRSIRVVVRRTTAPSETAALGGGLTLFE